MSLEPLTSRGLRGGATRCWGLGTRREGARGRKNEGCGEQDRVKKRREKKKEGCGEVNGDRKIVKAPS